MDWIRDEDFFAWLGNNTDRILTLEPEVMAHLIERCCQIKAEIVSEDEREGSVSNIKLWPYFWSCD